MEFKIASPSKVNLVRFASLVVSLVKLNFDKTRLPTLLWPNVPTN